MNCPGSFARRAVPPDPTCEHHAGLGGPCTCARFTSVVYDCPACHLQFRRSPGPIPGMGVEVPQHIAKAEWASGDCVREARIEKRRAA